MNGYLSKMSSVLSRSSHSGLFYGRKANWFGFAMFGAFVLAMFGIFIVDFLVNLGGK